MTTQTAELIEVKPIKADAAQEYSKQALTLEGQAKTLVIKNQANYEDAAALLKTVKGFADQIEAARKKITKPLDDAKKAVMDLFRRPSDVLADAEKAIKTRMIDYSNEQERLRKAEEERLAKIARAEEERQRKAKEAQEAEWRRKEAEAKAELDRQNALIAKAKNEKARAEAEAATAKARAEQEKAARLAEERRQQAAEVYVPAPAVASTVEKLQGVSMKKNWKARVINEALVPREYLIIDLQKLDKIAKAVKGSLSIPGVEFYSEDVLASR